MPPKHRDGDVVAVVRGPSPCEELPADTRIDTRAMDFLGAYRVGIYRVHRLFDCRRTIALPENRAE